MMKKGLLLINLGTPEKPTTSAVRTFLAQFLRDKRVIGLPAPLRYLLVYGAILPFRPQKTAKAYQAIWTEKGSPLLVHSENLQHKLQKALGDEWKVVLGMRYGNPSIAQGLEILADCQELIVLPLYPQYATATTESSLDQLKLKNKTKPFTLIKDFFDHPGFIAAQASLIEPELTNYDYLLFSYHGLPEYQLNALGCKPVCPSNCPPPKNVNSLCYKAQCYATTNLIAQKLKLSPSKYGVSFQSRLGKTPWIKPYTESFLHELIDKGVRRLAVVTPSFVADCLETLEEIGLRAKHQWSLLGGEQLTLIPCVNDSDLWVKGLIQLIQKHSSVT